MSLLVFIIEYCHLTEMPNIFKVPKKVPEEKVPVPVQKKEAPPAKGTSSLLKPELPFNLSLLRLLRFMSLRLVFDVFVYENLLLIVLNIKTIFLKCPKYKRKYQKRKFQKRKSLCLKKKWFPQLKVFWETSLIFMYCCMKAFFPVVFILYLELTSSFLLCSKKIS